MKSTVRTKTREIEVVVMNGGEILITTIDLESGIVAACAELQPNHALDLAAFLRYAADIAIRRMESNARGGA